MENLELTNEMKLGRILALEEKWKILNIRLQNDSRDQDYDEWTKLEMVLIELQVNFLLT